MECLSGPVGKGDDVNMKRPAFAEQDFSSAM